MTLTPGQRAQLALAVRARDVADLARALVGDLPLRQLPGEGIRAARLVRMLSLATLDAAVLLELARGSSWEEIAEALDMTPERVQEAYLEPWLRLHCAGAELDLLGDCVAFVPDESPEQLAVTLDQWFARHAEPWDGHPDAPVATAMAAER